MSTPSSKGAAPNALHQPFTWLPASLSGDRSAELAALTKTLCLGMATCLNLVQQNRLAQANDETPLLTAGDAESLLMLAAASAQMLSDAAEEHIDLMWDRAERMTANESTGKRLP